jgi:hypothetical protein
VIETRVPRGKYVPSFQSVPYVVSYCWPISNFSIVPFPRKDVV